VEEPRDDNSMQTISSLTPVQRRIPPLPLQSALTTPRPRRGRMPASLTPASSAGDRFIPNRRKSNVDEAHFLVTCADASYASKWPSLSSSSSSASSSSSSSNSASSGSTGQLMPPPPVTFSPTRTFDQAAKAGYRRRLEFLKDDGKEKQTASVDGGNTRRILSFSGSETRRQPAAAVFSGQSLVTDAVSTSCIFK
jgi:hypothetical protein